MISANLDYSGIILDGTTRFLKTKVSQSEGKILEKIFFKNKRFRGIVFEQQTKNHRLIALNVTISGAKLDRSSLVGIKI